MRFTVYFCSLLPSIGVPVTFAAASKLALCMHACDIIIEREFMNITVQDKLYLENKFRYKVDISVTGNNELILLKSYYNGFRIQDKKDHAKTHCVHINSSS